MKQFIAGFVLFVEIFFRVFGIIACRDHSVSRAYDKLSNDLFNESVLEFYDIPWLQKPESITEKNMEKRDGTKSHTYEGYIQDEQSFWEYGEYIYNTFTDKDYTIGVFLEHRSSGELFTFESWDLVAKPTSFEDCCESNYVVNQDGTIYKGHIEIYYSVKAVDNKYNSKKGGYEMLQPRRSNLSLYEEQDGSLFMRISCWRFSADDIFFVEK